MLEWPEPPTWSKPILFLSNQFSRPSIDTSIQPISNKGKYIVLNTYFPGSPRYIPPSLWILRVALIMFLSSGGTMLPKSMEDLDRFSCWPDVKLYLLIIFINSAHCWTSALQKKRLSSAKSRYDIVRLALVILDPNIRPSVSTHLSWDIKALVRMIKRKDDSGSPCLKPLVG